MNAQESIERTILVSLSVLLWQASHFPLTPALYQVPVCVIVEIDDSVSPGLSVQNLVSVGREWGFHLKKVYLGPPQIHRPRLTHQVPERVIDEGFIVHTCGSLAGC